MTAVSHQAEELQSSIEDIVTNSIGYLTQYDRAWLLLLRDHTSNVPAVHVKRYSGGNFGISRGDHHFKAL